MSAPHTEVVEHPLAARTLDALRIVVDEARDRLVSIHNRMTVGDDRAEVAGWVDELERLGDDLRTATGARQRQL